jgi:hypothetical protein
MPSDLAATVGLDKLRTVIGELVRFGSLSRCVNGRMLKKQDRVLSSTLNHFAVH